MTRDGLPTGKGTAERDDVADPHPSTEEHYDEISKPGGVTPRPKPDIGPNSYAHNGAVPPRPKNRGSGPQ